MGKRTLCENSTSPRGNSGYLQYARAQQPPVQSIFCTEAAGDDRGCRRSNRDQPGLQRKFPGTDSSGYIWSGKSHDRDSSGRIFLDTEKGRNFPDAGGGTCLFRRGTWKDEQDISPALPQTSCKRILERSCPSGGNQQLGSHL